MKPSASASREKFPWGDAMRLGLGILRLSPDAFWRMTPHELEHAAAGVFGRGETTTRASLENLMRAYPD